MGEPEPVQKSPYSSGFWANCRWKQLKGVRPQAEQSLLWPPAWAVQSQLPAGTGKVTVATSPGGGGGCLLCCSWAGLAGEAVPHLCLLCEPPLLPLPSPKLYLQFFMRSTCKQFQLWKSFAKTLEKVFIFSFWCNILTSLLLPNLKRQETPQLLHCFFGR